MDSGQCAAIIRDLDKLAREAAASVGRMEYLFRKLGEAGEDAMSADDAIAVDDALHAAAREMPELTRVFAKQVRLPGGPPPSLMLRATEDPGHLDIIARTPGADLTVGYAIRTGTGEDETWKLHLTEPGSSRSTRSRGSIGLYHPASHEELLEVLTRYMDDHGPWWAPKEGRGDG